MHIYVLHESFNPFREVSSQSGTSTLQIMQSEDIVQQLGAFATSLQQIIDVLPSITCTKMEGAVCSSSCDKCKLLSTRQDVVQAMMDMNQMITLGTNTSSASVCSLCFTGSLVLAPRFYRGSICWDFAIVTSTGSTGNLPSSSDLASTDAIQTEAQISILWAYPQSQYELHSSAITFSSQQLRPPPDALLLLTAHQQALRRIQPGDEVLYPVFGTSRESSGTYQSANVVRVGSDFVIIAPSSSAFSQQRVSTVQVPLSSLRLPPQPACNDNMISATRNRLKSTAEKDGIADEESQSNSDNSCDGDSEHEGITSLPSYLQQHISKVTSRSNLQSESGLYGAAGTSKVPVGLWEQHTKGTATQMTLSVLFFLLLRGKLGAERFPMYDVCRRGEQDHAAHGL
jgi:hypothetical protein